MFATMRGFRSGWLARCARVRGDRAFAAIDDGAERNGEFFFVFVRFTSERDTDERDARVIERRRYPRSSRRLFCYSRTR